MKPETRRTIQAILLVVMIVAAVRLGIIFYQRHAAAVKKQQAQQRQLNPTFYVVPKKLYPYDLKSARQLTQHPVWVKEGYRFTYYPYDSTHHRADVAHEAGTLGPIEKLNITDVVVGSSGKVGDQRPVWAVFQKDQKPYAVQIGVLRDGTYQIYSDEMFFIQDPQQLYSVWPSDVWDAIAKHEIKPGMDEIQASFAVGMGTPQPSSDPDVKTVIYPNGGRSLTVTFRNGRAAEVKPSAT